MTIWLKRSLICAILVTQSIQHCNENKGLKMAIVAYFQTEILPFHDAAMHAVASFNRQYPELKLQRQDVESLLKIVFLHENATLKIKPHEIAGSWRVVFQASGQRKEHIAITPNAMNQYVFNLLKNNMTK